MTTRQDVKMSELTMQQQREINKVDSISISKTREVELAKAIAKLHNKMFKPKDIRDGMRAVGDDERNA